MQKTTKTESFCRFRNSKRISKRGYIVWNSIAKGILVLIILGVTFKIVVDLTGNPVQYLLGYGNISKLDQEIEDRYEITRGLNQDAITSINGLIYGINSLAVFDTDRQNKDTLIEKVKAGLTRKEDLGAYKKDFDDVKVEPTYYDRRTIRLKGNEKDMLFTMANSLLDCWGIFGDKANTNTRCFLMEVDEEANLNFIEKFPKYIDNFKECDKICADSPKKDFCISKCKSKINDINGGWTISFWNLANYDYDLTKEGLIENNYQFRICGNNDYINEIHFSFKEDNCETPKEDLAFGYVVENFALPQNIEKSSSPLVYGVEEWLSAYGDPEYILFYEKFPKEEAEYWRAGAYNIAFLTIIGTEAAFLGIDVMTLGLGKAFRGLGKVLGKTVIGKGARAVKNAIKGFGKSVGSTLGRTLRWVWSRTGGRAVNALLRRQITKETLEESAERIIKNTLKKGLKKGTYNQLDDDAFKLLKNRYIQAFNSLSDESFDQSGRLTQRGINQLDNEFSRLMKGTVIDSATDKVTLRSLKSTLADQYDDTILRLGKEISEEASQAGLRTVPRSMVRAYKSAGRARNMLSEIFTGDMTEKKRTDVLMAAMKDWDDTFKAMKPHELRTFVANQKSATEMLDRMITGEIGDAADKAAAQTLRTKMDDILDRVVKERGDLGKMFTTSAQMQKYSSAVTKWEISKLQKPRHLVALMAGYYATKIESMQAKFNSVGTNAIGLKTPYAPPIPYDDTYTKHITSTSDAKGWLDNYGNDERHSGLLPVVNEYYLSLTKDRFAEWYIGDQEPQRFHLVSPCYADVILTVSNCDCKGSEDEEAGLYETGKRYEIYGEDENGNKVFTGETTDVAHFDEKNTMLYRLDENAEPIKECYAGKWYKWDDNYPTKCIKINPVLDTYKDFGYNYCYHGKDPAFEIVKGTITSLEIGLPLLCTIATSGAGIIPCFAGVGFISGLAGESTKAIMETQHKWPNHR